MLDSALLTELPPSLADVDLDGANFAIGLGNESLGINGTITKLVYVPDPSVGILLGIGALGALIGTR